jgi:spermidine/putrescine transport system permease protein
MAATPSSEARTGLKLISPPAVYVILLLAAPLATVLIYSVLTGGGAMSRCRSRSRTIPTVRKPVYRADPGGR